MAKVPMPSGPTRLHKNMQAGMPKDEAEDKALGKGDKGAPPKTTRK